MTIYALSTASGVSGIAIIRLSGDNSIKIAQDITHTSIDKPRTASLKTFYDADNIQKDIVILVTISSNFMYMEVKQ